MSPRYSIVPGDTGYNTSLTDFDCRILVCIGSHTDKNGWCYLNQGKLAERLGKTRRGVNGSVRRLCELGYLEKRDLRSSENGSDRQNICFYRVVMDRGEPPMTVENPASQPTGTEVPNPLGNDDSQHNVLSFSSSQRDNVPYAEQDNSVSCKKYTGVPSEGAAVEDFQSFAMDMKKLDQNHLLAGGVLFSATNPEGYPKLGELADSFGMPVFEEAVREVLDRELRDGKMRRGGIRSWSYFAGQAADIAKKRASGGMPSMDECRF